MGSLCSFEFLGGSWKHWHTVFTVFRTAASSRFEQSLDFGNGGDCGMGLTERIKAHLQLSSFLLTAYAIASDNPAPALDSVLFSSAVRAALPYFGGYSKSCMTLSTLYRGIHGILTY